mgnify:CR=1 FL=1
MVQYLVLNANWRIKFRLRCVIAFLRLETYSDDKVIVHGAWRQINAFRGFLAKRWHIKNGRHQIMVPASMFA